MKTALELLGDKWCKCEHDLELVAQRAREEMREMAAREAMASACVECGHVPCAAQRLADGRIRELPVKP